MVDSRQQATAIGAPLTINHQLSTINFSRLALPAGISPATWRFEAARSNSLSYGSMKWGRRGDSHSRGANRPAVYETAAVAAEPRRQEMVGRHGAAPCSAV